MVKQKFVPTYEGELRKHTLEVPRCISECSGIRVFGRRIKSLVFSTDVAIIKNINADAVIAVIAFLIYLVAGNAECNRGPFDLPESESELTAGYHTEYSGMHFGYYYLAEYLNLFICAGMASTMFLGGWAPLQITGLDGFNHVMDLIPGAVWFVGKTFFVVFLLMWLRWTFPRLRIDQILSLEWKYLVPFTMVNLVLMAVCVAMGWTL